MNGTLEECAKRFFETYQLEPSESACKEMFSLLGIDPKIGAEWLQRATIPSGEYLLRFRFMLEAAGYDPPKPKRVSPLYDEMEKQLAIDEVSIPKIACHLNISKKRVVRIMVNRTLITERKEALLRELIERRYHVAQKKFQAWQQAIESWKTGLRVKESLLVKENTTNNQERKEPSMTGFKGTTKQCTEHFAQKYGIYAPGKINYKLRNEICHLLGTHSATGQRWFGQLIIPTGTNALKLRLFLELAGYQIKEREGLSVAMRRIGDSIALTKNEPESKAAITEIAKYLEFSEDSVTRAVVGLAGISQARERKAKELAELLKEKIEEGLRVWKQTLRDLGIGKTKATDEESSIVPAIHARVLLPATPSANGKVRVEVQMLAHMLLVALPLAEKLVSSDFTCQDREQLRVLAATARGSNAVFELSNLLNRLCGDRAFKEYAQVKS